MRKVFSLDEDNASTGHFDDDIDRGDGMKALLDLLTAVGASFVV